MRAIILDLDIKALKLLVLTYSENEIYSSIELYLGKFGFTHQQNAIYFGNETVTPVTCVLAMQGLCDSFPWFQHIVKNVRMLKIDENDDLMPAIKSKTIKNGISRKFHVVS